MLRGNYTTTYIVTLEIQQCKNKQAVQQTDDKTVHVRFKTFFIFLLRIRHKLNERKIDKNMLEKNKISCYIMYFYIYFKYVYTNLIPLLEK